MDRRKALKNMGAALGYSVTMPTLMGIFQGCKTEKVVKWIPDFLSGEEGAALTQLVDIILPRTDTPSASEVQVHLFIDKFADQVMEKEQQDFMKMTMGRFLDKAIKDSGKENVLDLSAEDLEASLSKTLKVTQEDEANHLEAIAEYKDALEEGQNAVLADAHAQFAFANDLRGLAIWGYKTSEYVGEEVLDYLPVPGGYVGCGDLEELTGGKAWSL
ncbi:MAG: gluconate 2-dehydrogenase subunit 3 family protein [Bacteroidota bacterium]